MIQEPRRPLPPADGPQCPPDASWGSSLILAIRFKLLFGHSRVPCVSYDAVVKCAAHGRVALAGQATDDETWAALGRVPLAGLSADIDTSVALGHIPLADLAAEVEMLGARPRPARQPGRRCRDVGSAQRRHARRPVHRCRDVAWSAAASNLPS